MHGSDSPVAHEATQLYSPERESIPEPVANTQPRSLPRRLLDHTFAATSFLFGSLALLVGLSVLATVPVLQLLTLGWMLEAEARVGRSGRLRDGFPGVNRVSRIGGALVGALLISLPFLVVGSFLSDARLLDPTSAISKTLGQVWLGLGSLTLVQSLLAISRGGRTRYFFQPFKNLYWILDTLRSGRHPSQAWTQVKEFAGSLRLGHYLALGTKGFLAGFLWLLLPSALLAASSKAPPLILLALLGVPLFLLVLPWLLMGQARLAAENRFAAAFELGEIRRRLARAPLVSLLALVLTLGLALPLYFWKIEPLPRDALWLPALFFIVALLPGRLLAGLAHARGERLGRASWYLRLPCMGLALPACGFYVFTLFFSQYFLALGGSALFSHHAFLLPVAFY